MENLNYEGVISFGKFKNVQWHQRDNDRIFLNVVDSDNFKEIESNYNYKRNGDLTKKERNYFNGVVSKLAKEMRDYILNIMECEIYDDQIGYGQEIINLVVVLNKNDFNKLK